MPYWSVLKSQGAISLAIRTEKIDSERQSVFVEMHDNGGSAGKPTLVGQKKISLHQPKGRGDGAMFRTSEFHGGHPISAQA